MNDAFINVYYDTVYVINFSYSFGFFLNVRLALAHLSLILSMNVDFAMSCFDNTNPIHNTWSFHSIIITY